MQLSQPVVWLKNNQLRHSVGIDIKLCEWLNLEWDIWRLLIQMKSKEIKSPKLIDSGEGILGVTRNANSHVCEVVLTDVA